MSQYQGDGNTEVIDTARLTLGNVVRMPYQDGAVAPFSDSVVTGIFVSYGGAQRCKHGTDRRHFTTLQLALEHVRPATGNVVDTDTVYVKLARPYCYANNPFESIPNWLVGVETYEALGNRIVETHKVVCMSTGDYANYNHNPIKMIPSKE